jgi:glycosyltransferase involved in cell wall biosynthesis
VAISRTPSVSVVISVFRRPQFLASAIRSALAQRFGDLEVIVAEDGGSDCAADVVAAFDDPRLRLCRCERNLGEAGNRVHAYRQARGRYLVNLDDDDALRSDFVESLLEPLERDPRLVLAFCDHHVIDVDGRVDPAAGDACTRAFGRDRLAGGAYDPLRELGLASGMIPMNVAAMFRAELVLPLGPQGPSALPDEAGAADDLYLTYLACIAGRPVYYIPRRLADYRVHDGQLTMLRVPATSEAFRYCYGAFLRDPQLRPWHRELKSQLAHSTANLGIDLLNAGKLAKARRCLLESLSQRLQWRPAAGLALTLLPADLRRRLLASYRARTPSPAPAGRPGSTPRHGGIPTQEEAGSRVGRRQGITKYFEDIRVLER